MGAERVQHESLLPFVRGIVQPVYDQHVHQVPDRRLPMTLDACRHRKSRTSAKIIIDRSIQVHRSLSQQQNCLPIILGPQQFLNYPTKGKGKQHKTEKWVKWRLSNIYIYTYIYIYIVVNFVQNKFERTSGCSTRFNIVDRILGAK